MQPIFAGESGGIGLFYPDGGWPFRGVPWQIDGADPIDAPLNAWLYLNHSSFIAESGENTTARLSAPSGKTTSSFTAGRIQDDENPADAIDIASAFYTEIEWCLKAAAGGPDTTWEFRIVKADGTVLTTYSVTPELTVPAAAVAFRQLLALLGVGS